MTCWKHGVKSGLGEVPDTGPKGPPQNLSLIFFPRAPHLCGATRRRFLQSQDFCSTWDEIEEEKKIVSTKKKKKKKKEEKSKNL